jgi:uncharacterized membrane protein
MIKWVILFYGNGNKGNFMLEILIGIYILVVIINLIYLGIFVREFYKNRIYIVVQDVVAGLLMLLVAFIPVFNIVFILVRFSEWYETNKHKELWRIPDRKPKE